MKRPKRVAIIPIYNEAPTVLGVLTEVASHVDSVIAVDDGSTDDTPRLLRKWSSGRRGVTIIRLRDNVGMAGALKRGFQHAEVLLRKGRLRSRDILINIDADGQHRPHYIPAIARAMESGGWDVMLTRRDFSRYPLYKRVGNRVLSWVATGLSGYRYRDVESGLRFLRAGAIPDILDYFTGLRYSCAQEIALITALHGLRVHNGFTVRIAYYRPGATISDGFIVLLMSLYTYFRIRLEWKVR